MLMLSDFFRKEGSQVQVEGNRPLLLTDPQSVWLVESGKVTVFCAAVKGDGITGARSFLFEVGTGGILFGLNPEEPEEKGERLALLASGLPGTRLWRVELVVFIQRMIRSADAGMFIPPLEQWVKALAGSAGAVEPPEVLPPSSAGEPVRVKYAAEGDEPVTLESFHGASLRALAGCRRQREEAERQRFRQKAGYDRLYFEKAIKDMASVAQPGLKDDVREAVDGDPLFTACSLVGRAMNIKIVRSPLAVKGISSKDPLRDIARASRIRIRQVALIGEWYSRDNGPLLGFMEDDNRPVALIPLSPSRYQLHDPANNTVEPVNPQIARRLKPFAVAFYRPFPNKVLKLRDVLIFGGESCWKRDLLLVISMGVAGGLLSMVIPIATGIIFDTIIPGGEKAQLLQIAFFLGASALAGLLFQLTRSLAMLRLEGKMEGAIMAAVWDRLLSLPVSFFKDYTAGELAMRAMGVSQIRRMLSGVVINNIISSFFSLFNFGLLFYYSVKLAAVSTVFILAATLIITVLGYRQVRYERLVVDKSNRISGLMLQLLTGISKFRVTGAEKRAFYLITREFSDQRRIEYKSKILGSQLATFLAVLPVITSMAVFYAAVSLTGGTLGTGKFVAFNSALAGFMGSMVMLCQSFLLVNAVIPLYERSKPILEALPEYDEAKSDAGELTGSIEVSHVSFRYREDGPLVLDDVSVQIGVGDYVGIVGASGSGKSTLFRILLGFEKPVSGQVFYDGRALENLDVSSVRRQLGVVLQNSQLMSGDIYSNIVGANYHLTMDDAWEAAKMAGLDQDIREMPMGMYTLVSEGGTTLSGGQRQRLLIARAIVNRPRIIFFDEATSALDNRTQAVVGESLAQLKATRIVIAHRLSTVINCHQILVMDKGRIVERGTYNELMERGGFFADLARRQLA
ncbi:MAG: NHLP bacteriocin export ABC transporter permease/ATPase subunit [Peptococcaceae bacterium]|nr:NHLP bacteriocin export ABC transporter permease/ATPase subunit [Peptococcaceae bacterium]